MHIDDVREWFLIADQDFDSANFLTKMYPKPIEIICYHCTQAVEKYLKGFLEYNDVVPEKTHNLSYLLDRCIEINDIFKAILKECDFINRFTTNIRYIHRKEITETDVEYVLKFTIKIKNFASFLKIRDAL